MQAWVGHPNVSVLDNSMNFDHKIKSLIFKVTRSLDVDIGDRLEVDARKFKFVINGPLPPVGAFPEGVRDFEVNIWICIFDSIIFFVHTT